jgi:hypothetical protein
MISSEVQRTLVKSPPELWAELSDPALLSRHLGELGEIRITRVEPEQTVEWEAENTNGTVQIKPSGWGTRVTLTVTRELPEDGAEESAQADPPAWEPTPQPEPACEIDADPAWLAEGVASFEPEPRLAPEVEPEAAGEIHADGWMRAETEPLGGETLAARPYVWLIDEDPEPRRGFFARLFGRRRRPSGTEHEVIESLGEQDPVSEPAREIEPGEAEPQGLAAREDVEALAPSAADASLARTAGGASAQTDQPGDAPQEPLHGPDSASELKTGEETTTAAEAATAEVTAVLSSVLDRLGAAHHRPFSRS